jgi:hypothetical protein
MLGYVDISISLRVYAHVPPHMQQAAVEVMDGPFGREITGECLGQASLVSCLSAPDRTTRDTREA